ALIPIVYTAHFKQEKIDLATINNLLNYNLPKTVINNLENSRIKIIKSATILNEKDLNKYNKKIRYTAESLNHNYFKPKRFFPKSILNYTTHKYLLTFDIAMYLNEDSSNNIIYLLLFDTEKQKLVYYDAVSIGNCGLQDQTTLTNIINKLLNTLTIEQ
ncbi:MAG: hypothetical protein ACPG6B_07755, partial [Oceanihabitans sp.]